jgi:hypothetical protein
MPKASKNELQSIYQDHKVQLLISKFVSAKLEAMNPIFDPKLGVRYPLVEVVIGDDSNPEKFTTKSFTVHLVVPRTFLSTIHVHTANLSTLLKGH